MNDPVPAQAGYCYEQRGRLWAVFAAGSPQIVLGWGVTEGQAKGLVALYTRANSKKGK